MLPVHCGTMLELPPTVLLVLQGVLGAVTVDQLRRNAFLVREQEIDSGLILDVWAPIALLLPLLSFSLRVEGSMQGVGWLPLGAPIICGVLGAGAAIWVSARNANEVHRNAQVATAALICWAATAILLLLLSAAHQMTIWMGQCAFAGAAILLWMNTPEHLAPSPLTRERLRAGWGMSIVVLCALAHAGLAMLIPLHLAKISGGLMVLTAVMGLASAARMLGPAGAFRIAGWTACYGVLLPMGALSMARLVPEVVRAAQTGASKHVQYIAYDFGVFAIEAVSLLLIPALVMTMRRTPSSLRPALGLLIIVFAAGLAAWRLASIQSP